MDEIQFRDHGTEIYMHMMNVSKCKPVTENFFRDKERNGSRNI
jgi:hypothetical protein